MRGSGTFVCRELPEPRELAVEASPSRGQGGAARSSDRPSRALARLSAARREAAQGRRAGARSAKGYINLRTGRARPVAFRSTRGGACSEQH